MGILLAHQVMVSSHASTAPSITVVLQFVLPLIPRSRKCTQLDTVMSQYNWHPSSHVLTINFSNNQLSHRQSHFNTPHTIPSAIQSTRKLNHIEYIQSMTPHSKPVPHCRLLQNITSFTHIILFIRIHSARRHVYTVATDLHPQISKTPASPVHTHRRLRLHQRSWFYFTHRRLRLTLASPVHSHRRLRLHQRSWFYYAHSLSPPKSFASVTTMYFSNTLLRLTRASQLRRTRASHLKRTRVSQLRSTRA